MLENGGYMMKRLPYLMLFLAMLAVPLRASPPIGAVVQTWHYDPAANTVALRILNTSGKDITAWNIKIKETYAGVVGEHEYYTDLLQLMLNVQEHAGTADGESLRQQFGNGTFQAGTSRDETLHVQPGLTDYQATLDTVIYADKTAETTNQPALNRAVTAWKSIASTMQSANEIIKRALANTGDASPHETAAKEIEQLRRQWEAQHHSTPLDAGTIQAVLTDLKNVPTISTQQNVNAAAYLSNYVAKKDQRAAVLLEHATPKVAGAR